MKQPDTEQSIRHTDTEQNTRNHKEPGTQDSDGADWFGGTRKGAENVEGGKAVARDSRAVSIETGTEIDKVDGLDEVNASTKSALDPKERHPERDEFSRL